MNPEVPSWVYRDQIAALQHRSFGQASPPVDEPRERRVDPGTGPSRVRLSEAEVERLLNVDWNEVRRLVYSGRLEEHRAERGYGRWFMRAEVEALVKASLRGDGPLGDDPPRRTFASEGVAIGF